MGRTRDARSSVPVQAVSDAQVDKLNEKWENYLTENLEDCSDGIFIWNDFLPRVPEELVRPLCSEKEK